MTLTQEQLNELVTAAEQLDKAALSSLIFNLITILAIQSDQRMFRLVGTGIAKGVNIEIMIRESE